jgi:hAT family C-terminal dimerisation region
MATLPVTACSNERSVSILRRLKICLQSTMGTQRLNDLALLNIHRNIHVAPELVIEKLCEKPRRLPFRLI